MLNATWCLANFFKGNQPPNFNLVKVICPTLVETLLRTLKPGVIVDVLNGMALYLD